MEFNYTTDKPERMMLLQWLAGEWEYADNKFGDHRTVHDWHMQAEKIGDESWWLNQFTQYIRRAQLLDLETPNGRQQLAKCWAALSGCLESMIRVYGDLPQPGHTSGEVHEHDWSFD